MEWQIVAQALLERLAWMAVGAGVGLIVEWLWHPMDRLLAEASKWTSSVRS